MLSHFRRHILPVCGVVAGVFLCTPAIGQLQLLSPGAPVAADQAAGQSVIRRQGITINPTAAKDLKAAGPGAKLQLDFFPDAKFLITLNEQKSSGKGSATWTGKVAGKPLATFAMATVEEATVIDLVIPGDYTYSVRYVGNGQHVALETNPALEGSCGTTTNEIISTATVHHKSRRPTSKAPGTQKTAGDVTADTADQIDVFVAYTQPAETQAGGPAGMQALIDLAFTNANQAYTNSGIPLTLIEVGNLKVNYTEHATDMTVDLYNLEAPGDGELDELHAIRDAYHADMVCLMLPNTKGGACGIAFLMSGVNPSFESSCFAVVANTCISNQTFAHELGHNMGCNHDSANAGGSGAFSYSYGWRWNGTSAGNPQFRSVMAYAPGSRVNYFSNPSVNYDGTPTGTAGANNALSITNTAFTVANFRQRDTIGPHLFTSVENVFANCTQGQNAASFDFEIGNGGPGSVNYSVTDNVAWLSVTNSTGTAGSNGDTTSHTIFYNTSGLGVGNHTGTITVTDAGAENSPITVNVFLSVSGTAPANDNFVNAQIVTGASGTVSGSSVYSTRESGEPATMGEWNGVGQRSVWYRWTSPGPGNGVMDLDTVGSNYDTMLGVYTGSLGALTLIADNDEGGAGITPQSKVTFSHTMGTTYHILVDGWSGQSGSIQLNWTGTVPVTVSSFTAE